MSNKVLYVIVAVLILAGIGFYVYNNRQEAPPVVENSQNSTPQVSQAPTDNSQPAANTAPAPAPTPPPTPPRFSDETDIGGGPEVEVRQVLYDGSSFSPASLTIKAGDIVVFKNNSTTAFWPASAPHPTHTDYPEFDAKKAIPAGGLFQFKFTKVGTWGYHNHLNSSVFGKIIVTQ